MPPREEDPSRRAPEDYVSYQLDTKKAEAGTSALVMFAKDKPFFSTGVVLGLGVLAWRMFHIRYRPQFLGKTQEVSQYLIYTRLYVCGTVIAGATGEMANEFYK